jgi:hypothetical protein
MATVLSVLKKRFGKDIATIMDDMLNDMYHTDWSIVVKIVNIEYHNKYFGSYYNDLDGPFAGVMYNEDEAKNPGGITGNFNYRCMSELSLDSNHPHRFINGDWKRGKLPKNY